MLGGSVLEEVIMCSLVGRDECGVLRSEHSCALRLAGGVQ